jgi:hypothetical protein
VVGKVLEGVGEVGVEFSVGYVFVEVVRCDVIWRFGTHELEGLLWYCRGVEVDRNDIVVFVGLAVLEA